MVGSSPKTSSPSSASAIARRISGVGMVSVSERRSTGVVTTLLWGGRRGLAMNRAAAPDDVFLLGCRRRQMALFEFSVTAVGATGAELGTGVLAFARAEPLFPDALGAGGLAAAGLAAAAFSARALAVLALAVLALAVLALARAARPAGLAAAAFLARRPF